MRVRWIAAVMGAGLAAGVCVGQAPIERRTPGEPGGPVETLKIQARLVTLAVNAVDAHGAPVGGLDKADFRVLEDGAERKIAFFDRESATPLSIVISIDGSGSLGRDAKLESEAAKKFVKVILRPVGKGAAAGTGDEVDLQEFSDAVQEVVPFTNDPRRIDEGLGRLTRGDATAFYDAVYLASQSLAGTNPAGGRRRVLVLITDGENSVHGMQYDGAVEEAQRAGVMIYALIVVPIAADAGRNTGGEHALIQMAEDTGGKYFYIQDPKDLAPAFAKVSEDLRTQYVLGFYAAQGGKKRDAFRALKVELTDPAAAARVSLRYRAGYYAGK